LFGEFVTHSPEETFELAKRVGQQLRGGEVFLLKGDLGAGKTVFAKGVAAGLDIDPLDVTSPSFTLVNIHEGRLRFYHIDLYRLERSVHSDLGLDEIFLDHGGVTAIEWSDRLRLPPPRYVEIELSYVSDSERRVVITELR
jgi:tRNA threonylcarbamoyladenosine biosynthesis protein TsaE